MEKFNLNQLLNTVSKPTVPANNEDEAVHRGLERIEKISVYDLVPSNDNFYSVAQIEELKESIALFGVKQNLTVSPLCNGKYRLIAGHRRRLASIALVEAGKPEFEFVPCGIERIEDELIERLLLIQTNSTARELTDWEKIQQVKEMRSILEELKKREKLPGRMREMIAELLHTSPTQIGRLEAIDNNLGDAFKAELKAGNMNISTAYEISGLEIEEQQTAFAEYAKSGKLSVQQAKEIKANRKELKQENLKQEEPRSVPLIYIERDIPPQADTTQEVAHTYKETRCIDEGICPYCGRHFDAGMAIGYSTQGTPDNESVDCFNCGKPMEIVCTVEYFCIGAED